MKKIFPLSKGEGAREAGGGKKISFVLLNILALCIPFLSVNLLKTIFEPIK